MGGMRRVGGLLLAVVLGASLVACGGGDDSDDSAKEDDKGATTTEASGSDDTTDDVDLGDFTGECADFAAAFTNAGSAVSSAFTGGDSGDIEGLADYFREVGSKMPDEISDDFEVFADAYTAFAQALADADIDFSDPSSVDPEQLAQLEGVSEAFSSAEVQEASQNISDYMAEHCGG